jgi:hypothetical protein
VLRSWLRREGRRGKVRGRGEAELERRVVEATTRRKKRRRRSSPWMISGISVT